MLRNIPRTTPSLVARSMQQKFQGTTVISIYTDNQLTFAAVPPLLSRAYAGEAPQPNTSNVSNPNASSSESQGINKSRATEASSPEHGGSVSQPVSNPESTGLGQQEEQTESQDHVFSDPNKSQQQKKKETLEYGQNKKLDAADN